MSTWTPSAAWDLQNVASAPIQNVHMLCYAVSWENIPAAVPGKKEWGKNNHQTVNLLQGFFCFVFQGEKKKTCQFLHSEFWWALKYT